MNFAEKNQIMPTKFVPFYVSEKLKNWSDPGTA